MSSFAISVVEIKDIIAIPGADVIELAQVMGYQSVIKKDQFKVGDRAVYIPEQAIIPDDIIEMLGLTGKLAGAKRNRVKAIKLRGCLSQGILMGFDVLSQIIYDEERLRELQFTMPSDKLQDTDLQIGITKWVPEVPSHLSGEVANIHGNTVAYDIENYKKFPDTFAEGEEVTFQEKAHGTNCQIGVFAKFTHPEIIGTDAFVGSKGLSAKGLVFKDNERNADNLYMRTVKELDLIRKIKFEFASELDTYSEDVFIFGEIFGKGVQDLTYGLDKPVFMGFDIALRTGGVLIWLDHAEKEYRFMRMGIPMLPVLYKGPFSLKALQEHTDGKTTVGNDPKQIREGIIVRPTFERHVSYLPNNRVILKSVSGDYLTRKSDTATEFE